MAEEPKAEEHAEQAWPLTVTLKHPVQFGQERIAELEFRRGKLGDFKGMQVGGYPTSDQLMLIASRMSGRPIKVIELLVDDDAEEVMGIAFAFFAKCLPAGRTR
jgi:hypothetical protein